MPKRHDDDGDDNDFDFDPAEWLSEHPRPTVDDFDELTEDEMDLLSESLNDFDGLEFLDELESLSDDSDFYES